MPIFTISQGAGRRFLVAALALLLLAGPVRGQATQPASAGIPDVEKLDAPALRLLIRQLQQRVALLEAKLKDAESRTGTGGSGGAGGGASGEAEKKPDGGWVVRVTSNSPPDVTRLREEQTELRRKLDENTARVREGEERIRAMQGETVNKHEYVSGRDANGHYMSQSRDVSVPKYSDADLRPFFTALNELRAEKSKLDTRLRGVEDEIRNAQATRVIDATLEDGRLAVIKARGVNVAAASAMEPGRQYRIDGAAARRGEVLQITPSSIVAIDAGAPAAPLKASP